MYHTSPCWLHSRQFKIFNITNSNCALFYATYFWQDSTILQKTPDHVSVSQQQLNYTLEQTHFLGSCSNITRKTVKHYTIQLLLLKYLRVVCFKFDSHYKSCGLSSGMALFMILLNGFCMFSF